MRILVTGGAGYIGACVTRELLSAGYEVNVLDALLHDQDPVASALELAGAQVVRGDVRDPQARGDALAGAGAVVHLAAISPVGAMIAEPPIIATPSSSPALATPTTQVPFWYAPACITRWLWKSLSRSCSGAGGL